MPLHVRTTGVYGIARVAHGFDEVIAVMPNDEHRHDRPATGLPTTVIEVSDLGDWGDEELAAIVADHPCQIVPQARHARAILDAGRLALSHHGTRRVLVHCAAGASRSVAAAYAILALEDGPGREARSLARLVEACGSASPDPNRRIVRLCDETMGRGGRLLAQLPADDAAS